MKVSLVASAVATALAAMTSAWAQQVKQVETISVTASPLGREAAEMAQPATVLAEDELRRKRAASIGDTLSQEVGVQSSAFGAGAGRPIIRGLDGPRIRVLENGIGTGDVSTLSPDHAVTTESLRAEQIEILRGPASLLYGSGAIGGVVNVVSKTIPRERVEGLDGSLEARVSSANRGRTGSFDLNGGAGSVAWHVDAFSRRTRDYEIPGKAVREGFEVHHEDEHEEEGEQEGPAGRLANSDVDMRGAGVGASWIGSRGFLGAGAQELRNDYGVPSGEGVRIRMRQRRYEAAGEAADPISGFTRLKFRIGDNDYRHDEIESSGEVGTTFRNRATESRLELRHGGAISGTVGVQLQDREMSALGEEAILPNTRSRAAALFVVEEKDFGTWSADVGIRFEREARRPEDGVPRRDFSLATPALGLVWRVADAYRLALSATQAQRAPSVEELYTHGAHHATATFEIGDAGLRKEVSRNMDITMRKVAGDARWKVNVYANRISDFVYAAAEDADGDGVADRVDEEGALDPEGEFLVQRFTQGGARFRGVEAEFEYRPANAGYGVRIFGDLTRGRLAGGESLPRIAPARIGFNADVASGAWGASLTAIRAFEQRRTAPLESSTPAYTRLDAELTWKLEGEKGRTVLLFLQGTNLLDEEIRVHTSYLKNLAPQMGRSVTAGVRTGF